MPEKYSPKYLRIPEGKWYEIKDIFTRIDEELVEVIKGLDMIIDILSKGRPVYTPPTPPPPAPAPPPPPTVKIPTIMAVVDAPLEKINSTMYTVESTKDTKHNLSPYTDIITITAYGDKIYIDFTPIVRETTQLYPSDLFLQLRRSRKYDKLYLRSYSSTATVYITEWRIVGE